MESFKLQKNTSKEEYGKRGKISFFFSVGFYLSSAIVGGIYGDALGVLGFMTLLIAIGSGIAWMVKKPSEKDEPKDQ